MDRACLVIVIAGACSTPLRGPTAERCALPEQPTVLVRDGNAILQYWELADDPVWWSRTLPDDVKYLAFREAIRAAGAELARPISDEPVAKTDEEREIWRRERLNADLVYGGAGRVRPVQCLDAALFAYQHARYDMIAHPTEFIAHVLRKGRVLRVYFGASDVMFPPKAVYGLDQAKRDAADGWQFVATLHDHTIGKRGDRIALGPPVPSTADVHLMRNVLADVALESVWVTNGVFTGEVPPAALARLQAR